MDPRATGPNPSLVVMGVSGCGKSSVAVEVAAVLRLPLVEGDQFHSDASKTKMRAGIALTDADRAQWLRTLGEALAAQPRGAVLTCSALKRSYREILRRASPGLRFAWLDLDEASARARVSQRDAHLFPPSLVASQFATLEPPTDEPGVMRFDATLALKPLSAGIATWLAATDAEQP